MERIDDEVARFGDDCRGHDEAEGAGFVEEGGAEVDGYGAGRRGVPVGQGSGVGVFVEGGVVGQRGVGLRPEIDRAGEVGGIEAGLAVLDERADLFAIMTTGMATIAGTVMALYASFLATTAPEAAGHILVASFMAAPGSLAIARIMMPASVEDHTAAVEKPPRIYRTTMDAFARGVQDGVNMLIAVIAMLLGAVALVALANMILGAVIPDVNGADVTVGRVFGWIFAPVMWMLGIPWQDATPAGELMGTKMALNELLAYLNLSQIDAALVQVEALKAFALALPRDAGGIVTVSAIEPVVAAAAIDDGAVKPASGHVNRIVAAAARNRVEMAVRIFFHTGIEHVIAGAAEERVAARPAEHDKRSTRLGREIGRAHV